MLWEIDIYPAPGQPDVAGRQVAAQAQDLGLPAALAVIAGRGYLVEGPLDAEQIGRIARELLVDRVVERAVIGLVGNVALAQPPAAPAPQSDAPTPDPHRPGESWASSTPDPAGWQLVHVLPKPGVMDPVAQSALGAIADLGLPATALRTLRKYWFYHVDADTLAALQSKVLANDAIEQVIVGPLPFSTLEMGGAYEFQLVQVPLRQLDDEGLTKLSRTGQLYLSLEEMRTIQAHFRELGRDPTDVELETVAQTWSEHCSHKTLAGRIDYRDPAGPRQFRNMLKETIFAATDQVRRDLGSADWCVSVFKDNAGVVRFDERYNVCFKVETHNHPSALEPYGGANTGLGGVIRDPLGTGLGAKPICSTDVFCFAPPDFPADNLPQGVLHPRRVMRGVVSGVRDYGNRMGIPTVNGAIYFDPRYLGNPLVYCGNVGLLPHDCSFKHVEPGDHIVALGGRTGRDGIHGATFSSAELTTHSESLSGGAVQIGNAITEKMVLDVILQARDRRLYHAITDCGAGGFSSAVGEMGEDIGAVVWLDRAPLKYAGLSYTEIWISEAQERMVLAVPPDTWQDLAALCRSEGVEVTIIGQFVPTGRLELRYGDHQVGDLDMKFLHGGRPPVVRQAVYEPPASRPLTQAEDGNEPRPSGSVRAGGGAGEQAAADHSSAPRRDGTRSVPATIDPAATLRAILGSLNVASKEWVIRQYDHEVQGGSVLKPLVGIANDGPGDAAVVRPLFDSQRGLVVACGMNPRYGDFDTYHMAASAIDEAVRNCVAVGADPARICLLDNFCWGNTDRPETLGSLVRAAIACHDLAVALGMPFISGKDSLNNEFRVTTAEGGHRSIAIPPSLLISALGQIDDARQCVSMDLKEAGNLLFVVGQTHDELGGSHLALIHGLSGGEVPKVDPVRARQTFAAVHRAMTERTVRACHDLSEGGLVVAAAEMAFAGGLGLRLFLDRVPNDVPPGPWHALTLLFSESNTRFLCEVPPASVPEFRAALGDVPHAAVGEVTGDRLLVYPSVAEAGAATLLSASLADLKSAWQVPLRW